MVSRQKLKKHIRVGKSNKEIMTLVLVSNEQSKTTNASERLKITVECSNFIGLHFGCKQTKIRYHYRVQQHVRKCINVIIVWYINIVASWGFVSRKLLGPKLDICCT